MDHRNFVVRQSGIWICRSQQRIVPAANRAQIDSGEDFRREAEVAVHAGKVEDGNHCAKNSGKSQIFRLAAFEVVGLRNQSVRGCEIQQPFRKLIDARFGTNGVVADCDIREAMLEALKPFQIDWLGKRGILKKQGILFLVMIN